MIVSTEERSFRDVVIYRDDPVFSHKTRTFTTLAVDPYPVRCLPQLVRHTPAAVIC